MRIVCRAIPSGGGSCSGSRSCATTNGSSGMMHRSADFDTCSGWFVVLRVKLVCRSIDMGFVLQICIPGFFTKCEPHFVQDLAFCKIYKAHTISFVL